MAGILRPPSSLGMWMILGFEDLVIPEHSFKYLIARASRYLSIQDIWKTLMVRSQFNPRQIPNL